jgi:hypothetical protein
MNAIHDLLPGGRDNRNLVVSLTIEIGGELKKVRDHRGAGRSIGVTPTRPPEIISDNAQASRLAKSALARVRAEIRRAAATGRSFANQDPPTAEG